MEDRDPFPVLEKISDDLGTRIERHLETTFRAIIRHPSAVSTPGYCRYITGEMHPLGNLLLGPDVSDPAKLESLAEPMIERGVPCAVVFCSGEKEVRVTAILENLGFVLAESMPAMGVDIDQLPPTPLPGDCECVRVDLGEEADRWSEALAVGYEIPRGVADVFSPNASGIAAAPDADVQTFAVRRNGRYVCTSLLHLADDLAGIYCVATLPDERGQGLGAFATAEPLRIARELGYRVGVLQSSTAGYPVYQRLGFQDFGSIPLYVRMPTA